MQRWVAEGCPEPGPPTVGIGSTKPSPFLSEAKLPGAAALTPPGFPYKVPYLVLLEARAG